MGFQRTTALVLHFHDPCTFFVVSSLLASRHDVQVQDTTTKKFFLALAGKEKKGKLSLLFYTGLKLVLQWAKLCAAERKELPSFLQDHFIAVNGTDCKV